MTDRVRYAARRCGQLRIARTGKPIRAPVYEERQEPWVSITSDAIKHHD